jgi:hypothetical protein
MDKNPKKFDHRNIWVVLVVIGIVFSFVWLHSANASTSTAGNTMLSTTSSGDSSQTSTTPVSNNPNSTTALTTSTSTPAAPSCFTAAQAWNEIGQSGCVEFNVGYTHTSSRCNAYLDQYSNYTTGIEVWIPDGCNLGASLIRSYAGKTIDVSGTITLYDGAPEIEVTSASQVSLAQ